MTIRAVCANGHNIKANAKFAGRKAPCPKCGELVDFPAAAPASTQANPLVAAEVVQPSPGTGQVSSKSPAHDPLNNFHPVPEQDPQVAPGNAYQPTVRQIAEPEKKSILAPILLGLGGVLLAVGLIGACVAFAVFAPASDEDPLVLLDIEKNDAKQAQEHSKERDLSPNTNGNPRQRPAPPNGDVQRTTKNTNRAEGAGEKLRSIFGYDSERRAQLSEYLQLKGHPRGKVGVLNLKLLGRLNGICKNLQLEPDKNNYIAFPEKEYPEYREMFEQGRLFENPSLAQISSL